MKILIYADFRSGFARDWVDTLNDFGGLTVIPMGSRAQAPAQSCKPTPPATSGSGGLRAIVKSARQALASGPNRKDNLAEKAIELGTRAFYLSQIRRNANRLQAAVETHRPDVVHAMRMPYEGITAGRLPQNIPLVCSIWGNDFTLHAQKSPMVARLIRQTLSRTNGLHADAQRDIDIARAQFQLDPMAYTLFAPTSGGVRLHNIRLDITKQEAKQALGYSPQDILICNPRGKRGYVKSESFCALHETITSDKNVQYVFLGAGDLPRAQWQWSADGRNTGGSLIQTPNLNKADLYLLLRAADIIVSPTTHDGLPNSVLESMASGAIPIISNIDSVIGVIKTPEQGRVFELSAPGGLQAAVQSVLDAGDLPPAQRLNEQTIKEGYSATQYGRQLVELYEQAIARAGRPNQ